MELATESHSPLFAGMRGDTVGRWLIALQGGFPGAKPAHERQHYAGEPTKQENKRSFLGTGGIPATVTPRGFQSSA